MRQQINTRGYTYLIENGTHFKIGITTKTVDGRVLELQTGSPTKLKISAYSYNSNCEEMERFLHTKFNQKRLEGEWFSLNEDDVALVHNYFENNHLDEYYAPLSEIGVVVAMREANEKKLEMHKQRLDNLRIAEESKRAKAKQIEREDATYRAMGVETNSERQDRIRRNSDWYEKLQREKYPERYMDEE